MDEEITNPLGWGGCSMKKFFMIVSAFLFLSVTFGQTVAELDTYNCAEIQPTKPKLRLELLKRAEADQKARESSNGDAMVVVDEENTHRLSELLEAYGWLGISLVGCDGADAAWLIAQHADANIVVQKMALERLEKAVSAKQAMPYQLAYLTDRVQVSWGRKQVYGTQIQIVNNRAVPQPLENPETVDKRRASVGLTPLADYLDQINRVDIGGN